VSTASVSRSSSVGRRVQWAEVSEAQRLRHLKQNCKLKQLMAEQALDTVGFKAVLSKERYAHRLGEKLGAVSCCSGVVGLNSVLTQNNDSICQALGSMHYPETSDLIWFRLRFNNRGATCSLFPNTTRRRHSPTTWPNLVFENARR
jgi:hypothetical protein